MRMTGGRHVPKLAFLPLVRSAVFSGTASTQLDQHHTIEAIHLALP
jgi:hypothetical protein